MAIVTGPTRWHFDTNTPLGSNYQSGRVICKSGGVTWIVALSTTEVSRTWYCRNDAVTTAQSASGYTGWFVPNCNQLANPGELCRTYWDSYCPSPDVYWSDTTNWAGESQGIAVRMGSGFVAYNKNHARRVRAFRCVTY